MVNFMQSFQIPCVFLNIVATQRCGFIWLKNQVNMACLHAKDTLMVIADIVKLIAYKKSEKIAILLRCLIT